MFLFCLQLIILLGAELAQRTNTQRQGGKEGFGTMLVLLLLFSRSLGKQSRLTGKRQ
jgi:hypothetical protein